MKRIMLFNMNINPLILIFISVLNFGLMSCSSVRNIAKTENPLVVRVFIEQFEKLDRWKVTYQTSIPVSNLVFNRQVNKFRFKNWKSLTIGVSIKEADGKETIISDNEKQFTEVSFEIDSYYEMTPKDYEFFQAFSDRSLVMYTGHFNACPKNIDCTEPLRFSFKGRKESKIIILGNIFNEKADWDDLTFRGTYVYFGNIKPLERKHLTVILDPSAPNWLKENLFSTLPKLFSFYTSEVGYPLTFKPFILLNYSSEGEGSSI